jgi:hypothetical protein
MKLDANNVQEYLDKVPEERQMAFNKLRQTIIDNLPSGFAEDFSYGYIGFNVPHSLYPAGYHCTPEKPLPFTGIASQKNFIGLYYMGIYTNPELLEWFISEYPKHCKHKLDMGKSCIRLKKMNEIPYELIGELMQRMTVDEWIDLYEATTKAFYE